MTGSLSNHPEYHVSNQIFVHILHSDGTILGAFVAGSIAEADFRASRIVPAWQHKFGDDNVSVKMMEEEA